MKTFILIRRTRDAYPCKQRIWAALHFYSSRSSYSITISRVGTKRRKAVEGRYNKTMRQFMAGLTVAVFLVLAPISAHAASAQFFGPIVSPSCSCPGAAPGWGCVMDTAQRSMNFGISISIIIAVLILAYGGALFLFSPTNPENISKARSVLINAVVGIVIVLAAWLVVDFVMKLFYDQNSFGPWNSILGDGPMCIAAQKLPTLYQGPSVFSQPGISTGGVNAPLAAGGSGSCSATQVQIAATSAGYRITSGQANTLACLARFESTCGAKNLNYNWGKGSSAAGAFQVTLDGNSTCYDNSACSAAVGISGPLNCSSAFRGGNPIPGDTKADLCVRAAANLNCSAAAAACVLQKQGFGAWTADKNSAAQQTCIANGGA
jgi:hypothetical protein